MTFKSTVLYCFSIILAEPIILKRLADQQSVCAAEIRNSVTLL